MKKSVKNNYLFNVIYQILLVLMPIITVPYLSRVLGSYGNGTYSYTISMASYFVLFSSLGISLYGQREIAYYQNDVKNKTKVFLELFIIRLVSTIITMIIYALLFCIDRYHTFYYKILLLEFISSMLDITWFYQGEEKFKSIVIKNSIVKVISIICIYLFIKVDTDIWKYILIYCLSNLFGNLTLWFNLKKYLNFNKIGKLNFRKHYKPILTLFIPQIAVQAYTIFDKSMIGYITHDMNEVGFYDQASKIVKLLLTIITSMGTVMLPRIAACFSENKMDKIKIYMEKTYKFVFLLSFPMIFGIIAVSNHFVPLFFGDGFDKVKILLPLLSVIILFIGLSNVIGIQYLLPIKRQKEYTISIVTGAIVNVTLNLILIFLYNSIGACIATIISELCVFLVQLYYVRKEFDFKIIFKNSLKYLMYSILMFIFIYPMNILNYSNITILILQVVIGILIYGLCLVITKDEHIDIAIKVLKKIIKKK